MILFTMAFPTSPLLESVSRGEFLTGLLFHCSFHTVGWSHYWGRFNQITIILRPARRVTNVSNFMRNEELPSDVDGPETVPTACTSAGESSVRRQCALCSDLQCATFCSVQCEAWRGEQWWAVCSVQCYMTWFRCSLPNGDDSQIYIWKKCILQDFM